MTDIRLDIRKIHYVSGVFISIFIAIHLVNHLCAFWGEQMHIDVMNKLRLVYRNMLVESVLLIAVLIQIYSGIKLFFENRKSGQLFFERLHIWSGLYLAFFLLIHVGAILSGRFLLHLDTNFYFGVAGLNTFPLNLFFIPYYTLAILAFFGHVASIHQKKMKKKLFGVSVTRQSQFILCLGILIAVLILFVLTNGFMGFEIPREYDILKSY